MQENNTIQIDKEQQVVTIPFVAHESTIQRMENAYTSIIKRLIAVIIIMIIGIFVYFTLYMALPEEVSKTESQEAQADNQSTINQSIGDE